MKHSLKDMIEMKRDPNYPLNRRLDSLLERDFEQETKDALSLILQNLEDAKEKIIIDCDNAIKEVKDNLEQIASETFSSFENEIKTMKEEAKIQSEKIILDADIRSKKIIDKVSEMRGEKGERGMNGKDVDEKKIISEVLSRIPIPEGKDGSPDKPDEIVEKVNIAEKKINISSIKGLLDELAKIRQAIMRGGGGGGSKGGGGMGNTIHEVKDISSATTTISLLSHIAGNGTAIFGARYQGQVLDLGVHYTISEKTVTLLFTPEDSTKFSISYIRT